MPEFSRKTAIGGVFSLLAMIVSVGLVISEFGAYRAVRVQSSMGVDSERAFLEKRKVSVHLNVTFHKIPCELLNFDANDVMGNRDVEGKGNLFKQPVSATTGEPLSADGDGDAGKQDAVSSGNHYPRSPMGFHFSWNGGSFQQMGQQMYEVETVKRKIGLEGCRLWGAITVNRAPGNLHMSGGYIDGVKTQAAHTIHHFSFGNEETPASIPVEMAAAAKSLDGVTTEVKTGEGGAATVYEYFLKVVPSKFTKLSGGEQKFFQFSVAENAVNNGFMSSVYFRYDFAPVVVEWKETSESLVQFAVRVLSIVGGLVGVIGLVHAVVVDSVEAIRRKKSQMNKLR